MNALYYKLTYLTSVLFVLVNMLLLLTQRVSAAGSFSVSAQPTTVQEGGTPDVYDESLSLSNIVSKVTVTPSTQPTGPTEAAFNISGGCKIAIYGIGPTLLTNNTSGTMSVYTGGVTKYIFGVYHPDTSSYEGTRTCTISFSKTTSSDASFNNLSIASKTITVTDDEAKPAPEPTPQPTTTTPTTPSTQPVKETKKPDIPTTKLVDSEGNQLKPQEGEEKITFQDKQPIVISGTTVPNGEVKLYIFSEPQEATVTADEDGAWSYTVENIEPGDHRVEVEVTDPETGETSERQEVLAFAVAQADDSVEAEEAPIANLVAEDDSSSSALVPLLLGGTVILAGASGGAFWWMKRKKQQSITPQTKVQAAIKDASGEAEDDDKNTNDSN